MHYALDLSCPLYGGVLYTECNSIPCVLVETTEGRLLPTQAAR